MKDGSPEKSSVEFSSHERAAFEIGFDPLSDDASRAIRKIIDIFPWITDVAEHQFDQVIAEAYMDAAAKIIQVQGELKAKVDIRKMFMVKS